MAYFTVKCYIFAETRLNEERLQSVWLEDLLNIMGGTFSLELLTPLWLLSVFRKVVKKIQCIQSQLNSLGLACTAEDIGPVLASSSLIENSDSALATEIKDCQGKMHFYFEKRVVGLLFTLLIHDLWGKPGRACGKCIQALQHIWPANKAFVIFMKGHCFTLCAVWQIWKQMLR